MRKYSEFFGELFSSAEISSFWRWAFYGVAIGVPAAFVGIAFNWVMEFFQWRTLESLGGFVPPLPGGEGEGAMHAPAGLQMLLLAVLPALGSLLGAPR